MSLKESVRLVNKVSLAMPYVPSPDEVAVLPVEALRERLEKVQQVCREFGDYRGEVEMAKLLAELEGL